MPSTADQKAVKTRDKDATRAGLVKAATDVLAQDGFQGFGVNAIARRAGCDKQLIYRYFGGLDGLLDAIGDTLADWIGDSVGVEAEPVTSYGHLMRRLALGYLTALRATPLMQKIIAWELSAPSEQLRPLMGARSRGVMRWMNLWRGDLTPPPGLDAAMVNALVIGAIQQIVLSANSGGEFAGVALRSDTDWARAEAAILHLLERLYGP